VVKVKIEVGTRVKIAKGHWARARQEGTIVEVTNSGMFIVQFDRKGIGFNDGLCLQLKQEDLEEDSNV
jgi:hypothetical protein